MGRVRVWLGRQRGWRLALVAGGGALVLLLPCLACAGGVAVYRAHTAAPSPAETAERAYAAANAGRYTEASRYLARRNRAIYAEQGALEWYWDSRTRRRAVERVEVVAVRESASGTYVTVRVAYRPGAPQAQPADPTLTMLMRDDGQNPREIRELLIWEDGRWKLTAGN